MHTGAASLWAKERELVSSAAQTYAARRGRADMESPSVERWGWRAGWAIAPLGASESSPDINRQAWPFRDDEVVKPSFLDRNDRKLLPGSESCRSNEIRQGSEPCNPSCASFPAGALRDR